MKYRILVVDDEKAILKLLKLKLSSLGFEVLLAENGREFREQALEEHPDLVILDILLGSDNGVDIYQKLLVEGFDRKIPLIFLSALAKDRPPSPAGPQRVYALRSKPFDPKALVSDIECLLGSRATDCAIN